MDGDVEAGHPDQAEGEQRVQVLGDVGLGGVPVGGEPGGEGAVPQGAVLLEVAEEAVEGAAAAEVEEAVLDGVEGDGGGLVALGDPAPHVPHPVGLAPPPGGDGDGQVGAAARVGQDGGGGRPTAAVLSRAAVGQASATASGKAPGPACGSPSVKVPSPTPVKVEKGLVLQAVRYR